MKTNDIDIDKESTELMDEWIDSILVDLEDELDELDAENENEDDNVSGN